MMSSTKNGGVLAIAGLILFCLSCGQKTLEDNTGSASEPHSREQGIARRSAPSGHGGEKVVASALLAGVDSVTLRSEELTNGDLADLAYFPNVRYLSLDSPRLDDGAVDMIASVPHMRKQLQTLNLMGSQFTDGMVVHVGRLHGLSELAVIDGGVSDAGIQELCSLTSENSLEQLVLDGCNAVTDKSVDSFALLTDLEYLDIRHTSISADGIAELARRRPNLRIAH